VPRIIALDTGPSGVACGNPATEAVKSINHWITQVQADGRTFVILPELADYEVRRKLLANSDGAASVRRLDELVKPGGLLIYVPINTAAMRRAARMWADARMGGYSTAAEKAIDGDVIVAAQALEYIGHGDRLFIATDNDSHLSRYVGDQAQPWEAITP
jgi:hypothetical protein